MFDGVIACQNCDSLPFPVPCSPFPSNCQFAAGTTPKFAQSGANHLLVAGGRGSTLPNENARTLSNQFVPMRIAQSPNAAYILS